MVIMECAAADYVLFDTLLKHFPQGQQFRLPYLCPPSKPNQETPATNPSGSILCVGAGACCDSFDKSGKGLSVMAQPWLAALTDMLMEDLVEKVIEWTTAESREKSASLLLLLEDVNGSAKLAAQPVSGWSLIDAR